jgi:CheY-like chemotaxis protein
VIDASIYSPSEEGLTPFASRAMTQVLKKFGYLYVDVATNGLEAVQAAENTKYDLILMDLQASQGVNPVAPFFMR